MTYANIVITGFMGTGKSTVAPVVAEKMGRPFVDADTVLVEQAGKSIPEIFEQDGEPTFRKLEAEVCVDLAAQTELVIATGGGALLNPDTLAAMSSTGMVVCLVADESVLEARLTSEERAGRPLAAHWRTLYRQRKPAYDVIPYQIDVNDKTPEQIAEEIIALWQSVFG
ncbi:MAG: shikimate kinase [Chloroflexota bacterium]